MARLRRWLCSKVMRRRGTFYGSDEEFIASLEARTPTTNHTLEKGIPPW